ncbi:ferredoxin family protein [Aureimonas fodinaquatilis]|uniref:Ferredoxin family protein n=1 Tax=Aureimonas fodinaquatilis TaxID=2565783 RepID=A0A5B0E433_9HYPH|nr:ferredoxin family protein [Aureimonas fodinaquatilis]KAA0972159.1 ferredoxin family protein [Aureimonas fodinaquatilis]
MIELVSSDRCIECNICVRICPRNVFDAVAESIPVIARQEDCQTCFMCELYCPTDALYVAPEADHSITVSEEMLIKSASLGSYARELGWRRGKAAGTSEDPTYLIPVERPSSTWSR